MKIPQVVFSCFILKFSKMICCRDFMLIAFEKSNQYVNNFMEHFLFVENFV